MIFRLMKYLTAVQFPATAAATTPHLKILSASIINRCSCCIFSTRIDFKSRPAGASNNKIIVTILTVDVCLQWYKSYTDECQYSYRRHFSFSRFQFIFVATEYNIINSNLVFIVVLFFIPTKKDNGYNHKMSIWFIFIKILHLVSWGVEQWSCSSPQTRSSPPSRHRSCPPSWYVFQLPPVKLSSVIVYIINSPLSKSPPWWSR